MGDLYEAVLDGGGPWGIRLQGGKDFGVPLNVARVTPGSKAAARGILAGDTITAINGVQTNSLSHMEAQNAIKNSGQRLQLTLKKGTGVSLGEVKQVGSGGFSAQPGKTLYTTEVTHSAGVDHKFNAKPRAFGAAPASGGHTAQTKKFDSSEYARRKKEELEKYKEEQNKPAVSADSDVLRMLQNTKVSDTNVEKNTGAFSRLQESLNNEGQWADQEKSFRMTADGTDLSNVSPGSHAVMDDLKNHGSSGLKTSGAPSGGSKSFKVLQQMTDNDSEDSLCGKTLKSSSPQLKVTSSLPQFKMTSSSPQFKTKSPSSPEFQIPSTSPQFKVTSPTSELKIASCSPQFKMASNEYERTFRDFPPPPPEMMSETNNYNSSGFGNAGSNTQSGTFKMLQKHVESGNPDQVRTVFDQPASQRGQAVPAGQTFTPTPKSTVYNPSMPTGPNFRVGRASAPTFKPSSAMKTENKAPPPPAVNAGEVLNPNSKLYQTNQYPHSPTGQQPASSGAAVFSPSAKSPPSSGPYSGMSNNPSSPPAGSTHIIKSQGAPQAVSAPASGSDNELYCSACQQPLSGGPFVSAIGKTWHPDHFCCSSCNMSLQNQAFVEENNQLFCEKCYNSYYAPKCAHCNQAIIGIDLLKRDVICDQCSSKASAEGIYDPISCSQSINWLLQQIREANTDYEQLSRQKAAAADRARDARLKIASMNKRRTLLEAEIEEYEYNFETTRHICEYKLKMNAANENLYRTKQISAVSPENIEQRLYEAKNKLGANQMKYNSLLSSYKDKHRLAAELDKRNKTFAGNTSVLGSNLREMQERVRVLQGRQQFHKYNMENMQNEMSAIEEVMEDAESRSVLAEQYFISLQTHRDTITEEFNQLRVKRLDAIDHLEELKRLKKEIMKKYNISHPSQLLARKR